MDLNNKKKIIHPPLYFWCNNWKSGENFFLISNKIKV